MRSKLLAFVTILALVAVSSVFAYNRITRGVALIGELWLDNPLDVAYISPQLQQQADDVTITSAQILALNTTPVSIVAAPGASYASVFDGALCEYDYGATAYTLTSMTGVQFRYTNGSGTLLAQINETGFLDQTNDELRWTDAYAAASGDSDILPVANAAIVAFAAGADPTLGDGTMTCRVFTRRVLAALP